MRMRATQKNLLQMKLLLLLLVIFIIESCSRKFYYGVIAVEQHLWELKKIDTFYRERYRPSAMWYNRDNRLAYVDNDQEFPYPFLIGAQVYNFDRK